MDAFARALLDPTSPPPPGLTTARGTADPSRFNIYRNNVVIGLTRALEGRFPVVRKLVGDAFFRCLARAYMAGNRPETPLIFDYGDTLPDFIEIFEPAAQLPYLADVARVEVRWTRAYHAREAEPLTLDSLSALPADTLDTVSLRRHPSAQLVRSRYPIGSIWAANQGSQVTPTIDWRAETVLIVRPRSEVGVSILPSEDAAFAESLLAGQPLAMAASTAIDDRFDFGTALVGLISLGAFSAIECP